MNNSIFFFVLVFFHERVTICLQDSRPKCKSPVPGTGICQQQDNRRKTQMTHNLIINELYYKVSQSSRACLGVILR